MFRHTVRPTLAAAFALTLIVLASDAAPSRPPVKAPAKKKYVANRGAKITTILPGSPAADAGLEVDDIIVSVNGVKITSTTHLINALKSAGGTAQLVVINNRDGQQVDVTAFPKVGKLGIDAAIVELSDPAPYSSGYGKRKKR